MKKIVKYFVITTILSGDHLQSMESDLIASELVDNSSIAVIVVANTNHAGSTTRESILALDMTLEEGQKPYRPGIVSYRDFLDRAAVNNFEWFEDDQARKWKTDININLAGAEFYSARLVPGELDSQKINSLDLTWSGQRQGHTSFSLGVPLLNPSNKASIGLSLVVDAEFVKKGTRVFGEIVKGRA